MIKKVAATAMVGSIVALKFSHIIIGRVLVLAPDTKMVTTTSSSEVTMIAMHLLLLSFYSRQGNLKEGSYRCRPHRHGS